MMTDELPDDPRIDALLASLDEPTPSVAVEAVLARARARASAGARWLRWAASILLALGVAGVAYAAPHSPVSAWVGRIRTLIGLSTDDVATPAAVPDSAGVVLDADDEVSIRFEAGGLAGHARVSLSDADEVLVRAVAGSTRFTSEPERLLVVHPGIDTMDIVIPRGAARVEIQIGSSTVLVKEGREVVTTAATDGQDGWLLTLGPARP
jgi:hypothetical protein